MVKPLAICIEDLDAVSEASKYLRCVALPGRQPGLRLDETGAVLWQPGDVLACELWVSADDRLILYRQEGMAPALLRRGDRSLNVPCGKPVVVLDQDQIDIGPRHLRVHVHGETSSIAAPSPLPPRSPLAGRLAQTVATAALLGAMAATGGCAEVEVVENVPEKVVTSDWTEQARGFAGKYVSTDGEAERGLTIWRYLTYASAQVDASGTELRREGLLVTIGNSFWFDEQGPASAALIPVLWGERHYLVEARALERFCAPNSGEPRTTREGYFYLREGDWSLPAEGAPMLLDGTPACSWSERRTQ